MAKAPTVPDPQDKVGKKIDYLAARLGQALAEHGFKRSGRTLAAEMGEGLQRHWRIVNLQAGKWNSGASGEFYVNVALQFPAVIAVLAKAPQAQWWTEFIGKPDEAAGQIRARLDQLAPSPADGEPVAGIASEERIHVDSDLADLAARLISAVQRFALPWLERDARVEAVRDHTESLLMCSIDTRIAAALALDDIASAQRLLQKHQGFWSNLPASALADKHQWLGAWPLDLSVLPHEPAPREPDSWTLKQQAKAQAEAALHEAEAAALRTQWEEKTEAGAPPEIATLAQAWMAEYQARWRSAPQPLIDLPSGPRIAAMDATAREQLLLALLDGLVADEAHRPVAYMAQAKAFAKDEAVEPLVKALLPTLEHISESTGHQLFSAFAALCGRIEQELITGRFTWALASLVAWLDRVAQAHREALKPDVSRWLQRLSDSATARYALMQEETLRELARPLNPDSPTYDVMLEVRAQMQARAEEDASDVLRRLREYPEQTLAADDKQAVKTLRRWLRRDAVTDALPLAFEPDDWGTLTQQAWDALPATLRETWRPALEWLVDSASTKPSKRWLTALDQQIAALPAANAADAVEWRGWLLQRLQAFEQTEGKTEWATTGARPGVGARLGESNEALLTGLLWWAWRDSTIPRAPLVDVLQSVALAAWRHLDQVGARAPGIGALALQMLAGCGPAGRDWVAAQAKRSAKKQFQKALEQALAKPLG